MFGYDYFNDNIIANTHASGSDYRIRGTSSIVRGDQIFPVFLPGSTTLDRNPLVALSEGSNLRVHSLFANDTWRINQNGDAECGSAPRQERCDRWRREDGRQRCVAEPARLGRLGPERRRRVGAERQLRPLHDGADEQPRGVDGEGRKCRDIPVGLLAARRSTRTSPIRTDRIADNDRSRDQAGLRVARRAWR